MYKTLILIFCCSCIGTLFCAAGEMSETGGLSFYSNSVETPEKTRYDVFTASRMFPKDSLVLLFDMEIIGGYRFGHIFTCKSAKEEFFNVVVQRISSYSLYELILNLTFADKKLTLSIPDSYLGKNRWKKCNLKIYLDSGTVYFSFGDYVVSGNFDTGKKYTLKSECRYVFGKCDYYTDVIAFSIRNLHFCSDRAHFRFPLVEREGLTVHSDKGKICGNVLNPLWLADAHVNWKSCKEFKEDEIVAVYYDANSASLLFYTSTGLHVYEVKEDRLTFRKHPFKKRFRIRKGGGFNYLYDQNTGNCFIFNNTAPGEREKSAVVYNYRNGTLEILDRCLKTVNKRHHNVVFSDKGWNRIWQFGGSGDGIYQNDFCETDMGNSGWKTSVFGGNDHIEPRCFITVAEDFEDDREYVYLFGGYGTKSGKKEDCGIFFYDLHRIDLKSRQMEKLCEFEDIPFHRVPGRNMILGEDEHSFYALMYSHFLFDADAILCRFDWGDRSWKQYANPISFIAYKHSTQVHLFEDKNLGYLLAVIQEFTDASTSMVRIFRILTPVLPYKEVGSDSEDKEASRGFSWKMLLFIIVIFSAVTGFMALCRRTRLKPLYAGARWDRASKHVPEEIFMDDAVSRNQIYLLGDFSAFDRNGKNITYRFSSKIMQLFLLIFLNSERKSSQGVSSDEISSVLWPDKELSESGNVRRVTMANLRDVLSGFEGVQVVNDAGKWRMDIDYKLFRCDFHSVCNPSVDFYNAESYDKIRPYVHLLRRGPLLRSKKWEWLDVFKSEYEEKILDIYSSVMRKAYDKGEYLMSYRVSQVLLSIDVLDENLMKIEINSLIKMGDSDKARVKFRMFSITYYEAYGKNLMFEDYIDAD